MKLLIVDDQRSVFLYLQKALDLAALGFGDVSYAENGIPALERIEADPPDVMLMDIQMPRMNGLELLQALRDRGIPQPETIVLSAYDEFVYARRCIDFGVRGYVLKPIDPKEIAGLLLDAAARLRDARREALLRAFPLCCVSPEEAPAGLRGPAPEYVVACLHGDAAGHPALAALAPLAVQTARGHAFLLLSPAPTRDWTPPLPAGLSSRLDRLEDLPGAVQDAFAAARLAAGSPGDAQPGASDAQAIARIRAHVDAHPGEDLSLGAMAERFFVSRYQISRLFKQLYGVNYQDYVLSVRMRSAADLLERTPARLYEIALAVGFDEPSYFSNVFKRYFGISPKEYRRRKDSDP